MTRRTPHQRDRDRDDLKALTESPQWAAVERSLRERQHLHLLTMSVSPAETPEAAFVLVHRQQALIADLNELLADPVGWLVPVLPDEEEDSETSG
jgi:hypothetical protein